MKHRMGPRLASMLVVWLLLLAWNLSARHIGELGNLLFLLAVAAPMAMSGAEGRFINAMRFGISTSSRRAGFTG